MLVVVSGGRCVKDSRIFIVSVFTIALTPSIVLYFGRSKLYGIVNQLSSIIIEVGSVVDAMTWCSKMWQNGVEKVVDRLTLSVGLVGVLGCWHTVRLVAGSERSLALSILSSGSRSREANEPPLHGLGEASVNKYR